MSATDVCEETDTVLGEGWVGEKARQAILAGTIQGK
jgi:hypothetical protein